MEETPPYKKIYSGDLPPIDKVRIMRIKKGFKLREIMGEFAVIGEGLEQVNFNKIISLNSTAAYIWKEIEGRDFDADMVADLLLAKYDVEKERAISDATALVQKLVENGLTE